MNTSTILEVEGELDEASIAVGKTDDSSTLSQVEVSSCNGVKDSQGSTETETTTTTLKATAPGTTEELINSGSTEMETVIVNGGTSLLEVTGVAEALDNQSIEFDENEMTDGQKKECTEEEIITLSSDSEIDYDDDDDSGSDGEGEEELEGETELEDESVGGVMDTEGGNRPQQMQGHLSRLVYPRQLSSSVSISLVGTDGPPKKHVTEVISLTSSDNDSDVEESSPSQFSNRTTRRLIVENPNRKKEFGHSMVIELEDDDNLQVETGKNEVDPLESNDASRNPSKCNGPANTSTNTVPAAPKMDEPGAKKIKCDEGSEQHKSIICESEDSFVKSTNSQVNENNTEKDVQVDHLTSALSISATSSGIGTELKDREAWKPRTTPTKRKKGTESLESLSPENKSKKQNQIPVQAVITNENEELTASEQKILKKLEDKIEVNGQLLKRKDEEEIDLSDENSAFIQMEDLQKKYLKVFKEGTKSLQVVGFTTQPRQIKIPTALDGHLAIQQGLEAFVRKRSSELTNENILSIVHKVASQESLTVQAEAIAKGVFQFLRKKVKVNRKREFDKSWPAEAKDDPARRSPGLASKLAANEKLGKKQVSENQDAPILVDVPQAENQCADDLSVNNIENEPNENSEPRQSSPSSSSTANVDMTERAHFP